MTLPEFAWAFNGYPSLRGYYTQFRDLFEPLNHSRSLHSNDQLLLKCPKDKYGHIVMEATVKLHSLPLNVRSRNTVDHLNIKLKNVLFN